MKPRFKFLGTILALVLLPWKLPSQQDLSAPPGAELRLTLVPSHPDKQNSIPAVAWLQPLKNAQELAFPPKGHYRLLQKNRMFLPHLQVVPVGSVVDFPNADPFFHNVFSLFDGKRFDLGLYEAGTSKSVTFSREGVSYIFCNIHPEMSAVVVALSTPLYAIADRSEAIAIRDVPLGEYRLHVWMEGVPATVLSALTRTIHIEAPMDLGRVPVPTQPGGLHHDNEYGKPYDASSEPIY